MASANPSTVAPGGPLPPALCVLGMGLIGGSLMRAAAPLLPVWGWSRGEQTRALARQDGYDVADTVEEALRRAAEADALVVLATPVTAFRPLLRAVAEHAPHVRLTDVGGVKAPIAAQVAELAPAARYIGSHPMTGTEHSGWSAGVAGLFDGAAWVTTLDEDSAVDDWLPVAGLALAVGSRVVPTEAGLHDDAAARISHLPHLLAAALAQVGAAGGPLALSLAAGSFADGTRVAATRPELVRAMCETNSASLVGAMDELLALIGVARGSLASSGSLAKIAEGGYGARGEFDRRGRGMERVDLDGDDLVDQLLSVGAVGGYVTGVRVRDDEVTVHAMFPADDDPI